MVGQGGNTVIYIIFGLGHITDFGIIGGATGLILLLFFKKLNHQVQSLQSKQPIKMASSALRP